MTDFISLVFSHPSEQGAEFSFKLGNSAWSRFLNFEAPSAETAVCLQSSTTGATKETHIAVSWTSGSGKYKLSKVITLAPRFMIKNELATQIYYRECGDAANQLSLQAGQSDSILAFSPRGDPALSLKYSGVDASWYARCTRTITQLSR